MVYIVSQQKRIREGAGFDLVCGCEIGSQSQSNPAFKNVRFLKNTSQSWGVVTTRSHIEYIITENGIADLYGKTLRQRATELVKIAHPNHQEWIEREYYNFVNAR